MEHFFRLFLVCGLAASVILILAVGLARNDAYLAAPVHLILFTIGLALYLLPAAVAWRRDCRACARIALVDVLLGWTVVGWVVSMYWAAKGAVRMLTTPPVAARPQPFPGH